MKNRLARPLSGLWLLMSCLPALAASPSGMFVAYRVVSDGRPVLVAGQVVQGVIAAYHGPKPSVDREVLDVYSPSYDCHLEGDQKKPVVGSDRLVAGHFVRATWDNNQIRLHIEIWSADGQGAEVQQAIDSALCPASIHKTQQVDLDKDVTLPADDRYELFPLADGNQLEVGTVNF